MRVVVTGGAGFIGSHLIEALVSRGDDIVCVERADVPRRWLEDLPVSYVASGIHDPRALQPVLDGADVVFHLAGLTQAQRPADYYLVNTEGTACLVEAAARFNGRAPRVVLFSSLAAVGPCRNGERLSPDTVPYPLSHYGHSKLLAEAVVHAFADRVPATVLRLPAVFGPRERGVLTFFQLVRRGLALTIGAWDREVSMLYVKDLVQGALAAAATPRAAGRTYCLAHPDAITWRGFADAAAHAVGRDALRVSVPRRLAHLVARAVEAGAALRGRAAVLNRERVRELTQRRWVCDPSRALDELGFAPAFPIPRGIAETVAWYREAAWL